MTSTSVAYRDGNFSEIFEVAKSNRLTQEETVKYSDSLQRLLDMKASINFADEKAEKRFEEGREVGREEGLAVGREEGRAEGREEGIEIGREQGIDEGKEIERRDSIIAMLEFGVAAEKIAAKYGLTVEEVMQLAEEN